MTGADKIEVIEVLTVEGGAVDMDRERVYLQGGMVISPLPSEFYPRKAPVIGDGVGYVGTYGAAVIIDADR